MMFSDKLLLQVLILTAVLILVLVDDALWREQRLPYGGIHVVLILVLVDDALWPQANLFEEQIKDMVLILVLVDDVLWPHLQGR